jgi:uncharacterized membrane protein YczE
MFVDLVVFGFMFGMMILVVRTAKSAKPPFFQMLINIFIFTLFLNMLHKSITDETTHTYIYNYGNSKYMILKNNNNFNLLLLS